MENNLQVRSIKAVCKLLESRDYEIIDKNDSSFPVIAIDNSTNTIAFCAIKLCEDMSEFSHEEMSKEERMEFEEFAFKYLTEAKYVDMSVRADKVYIIVIDNNKAMIKHIVNAMN